MYLNFSMVFLVEMIHGQGEEHEKRVDYRGNLIIIYDTLGKHLEPSHKLVVVNTFKYQISHSAGCSLTLHLIVILIN